MISDDDDGDGDGDDSKAQRGETIISILSHIERVHMVSQMFKAADLPDTKNLLYTSSNLTNDYVCPSGRGKRIASHIHEFFDVSGIKIQQQKQQQQHQQQQQDHWLTDISLTQTFLSRHFFDGKVNQLDRLMKDGGFEIDYELLKIVPMKMTERTTTGNRFGACRSFIARMQSLVIRSR